MDEAEKLKAFLEGHCNTALKVCAERFMRKLTKRVNGIGGRVSVTRSVTVDADRFELIVTDTIETRIFGPTGSQGHFDA